jgi:hypothetical protein
MNPGRSSAEATGVRPASTNPGLPASQVRHGAGKSLRTGCAPQDLLRSTFSTCARNAIVQNGVLSDHYSSMEYEPIVERVSARRTGPPGSVTRMADAHLPPKKALQVAQIRGTSRPPPSRHLTVRIDQQPSCRVRHFLCAATGAGFGVPTQVTRLRRKEADRHPGRCGPVGVAGRTEGADVAGGTLFDNERGRSCRWSPGGCCCWMWMGR